MDEKQTKRPNFRVTKKKPHQVFLQCSKCMKDIKEIKPKESISLLQAYYCSDCEPNPDVITMNPPVTESKGKSK